MQSSDDDCRNVGHEHQSGPWTAKLAFKLRKLIQTFCQNSFPDYGQHQVFLLSRISFFIDFRIVGLFDPSLISEMIKILHRAYLYQQEIKAGAFLA